MTNQQKQLIVKTLFLKSNLTQKEISKQTGVPEKTIISWKKKGNWDRLKASILITKEQELARLYSQINELNTAIESREEGERYANPKEADTMSKITASIKNLENEVNISDTISICIKLSEYINGVNKERGKEFTDLFDSYIKSIVE